MFPLGASLQATNQIDNPDGRLSETNERAQCQRINIVEYTGLQSIHGQNPPGNVIDVERHAETVMHMQAVTGAINKPVIGIG